jgi:hypothetical protein
MVRLKTKETDPGITDNHLDMLKRKREKWHKDYELEKEVREDLRVKMFFSKFPYYHDVSDRLPERYRFVLELYYGIGAPRMTTTQIGHHLPNLSQPGKPLTRQAVHLILKQSLAALASLNPERLIS